MKLTVLVYGWYFRGNIGDNLFVSAFKKLFPNYDFVFTDQITKSLLKDVSALFFGGGSFLYAKPEIADDAEPLLAEIPIFYIGVGTETEIHPAHIALMKKAKLIATRSLDAIDKVKTINPDTIFVPDLVFILQDEVGNLDKIPKSILILPSFEVVPRWDSPHWMAASWEYFKSEFSQALDVLYREGYKFHFFPMCSNPKIDDGWAATEIINKMYNRSGNYLLNPQLKTVQSITKFLSQFEVIITQRYHGIVLSEMMRTPYLLIHHHDKLKNCSPQEGSALSYYGFAKQNFLNTLNEVRCMKFTEVLPIEPNIFKALKDRVSGIIDNGG